MQRGFAGIFLLIGLLVVILIGAYFLFKPSLQNTKLSSEKPTQTNNLSNKPETAQQGSKFVYFNRILANPPENTTTYSGRTFKDQFIIYDINTGEKKVFHEETPKDDDVDSYRLFDDQYIAITSPRGNRILDLKGQNVSSPTDNFPNTYSPSGNVSVQFQFNNNDVIFSVANKQTGLRKTIVMKQDLLLVPSIVGWSKDENSVFFTLVQTHFGDPTHSLYQLDIGTGKVKKFPRDNSVAIEESSYSTWINSQKDEIYFKGKNGLFKQAVSETKAVLISFQNIHLTYVTNLVFSDSADSQLVALSDDQGLWIKDLGTSKEELIFERKNDGTVSPISWKGDNLIFTFHREGYNTEENNKKYGQYIIGNIYNIKTKKITEFAHNNSDSLFTLGRVYFIDWLK